MIECPSCGTELSQEDDEHPCLWADDIAALAADRDKWRDRCERLMKALDIAGKRCQDVHHSAKHQHSDDEDCLAAKFIYETQQFYRDAVCESVDAVARSLRR